MTSASNVSTLVDATSQDDVDEDALIEALENDSELDSLREQRRAQLHSEFTLAKQLKENHRHGSYEEMKDEKGLMDVTTSTKSCVVHFSKSDFTRCRIMHGHLERLAPQHWEARFLHIDVTNAPFLVERLKVQVLPCVLAFVDGKSVDRIIGFEGIGAGNDNFTTKDLEMRLLRSGILVREKFEESQGKLSRFQQSSLGQSRGYEDDEDDDWD